MGAQHAGFVFLRVVFLDDAVPQQARGTQLGDFHVEVHADAEEERQARREMVDVEAGFQGGFDVFLAVGQGEGQFQCSVGTGFLDVVARNRNGVVLRHVGRGVADDVGDDAHGAFRRVDIGVAHHEFFQNVVLDRAGQFVLRHALFLCGNDVHGQHWQHGAVHGHGDGDCIQRNAVEQDLHVFHGIDGDAGLADVAGDARVVGVVAAVGCQIECD